MILLALSFPFHMARGNPLNLRHDVPAIAPPPDRKKWERKHGVKPYPVVALSNVIQFNTLTKQARAAIDRDAGTIERDKAIGEQVTLEHVCERVKVEAAVPNGDHVFFDPSDNRFWIYPEGHL